MATVKQAQLQSGAEISQTARDSQYHARTRVHLQHSQMRTGVVTLYNPSSGELETGRSLRLGDQPVWPN